MARRAFSAAAPAFFAAVAAAAASAACFSTSAASRSAARRASPARNHSTVHFFRRLTGGPGAAGFATCYWYRSVARIARPAAAAAESSPAAWAAGVVGSGWHCSRARSRFTTSSVPSEKLVSSHASARGSGSAAIISVASPCAAVRHLCAPLLPTPGLLFPLRGELLQLWRLTKVGVLLAARGSGVRVQCKGLQLSDFARSSSCLQNRATVLAQLQQTLVAHLLVFVCLGRALGAVAERQARLAERVCDRVDRVDTSCHVHAPPAPSARLQPLPAAEPAAALWQLLGWTLSARAAPAFRRTAPGKSQFAQSGLRTIRALYPYATFFV